MCQMSHVVYHVSNVFFFSFFQQRGEASWWRVCYQRGYPVQFLRLSVFFSSGLVVLVNGKSRQFLRWKGYLALLFLSFPFFSYIFFFSPQLFLSYHSLQIFLINNNLTTFSTDIEKIFFLLFSVLACDSCSCVMLYSTVQLLSACHCFLQSLSAAASSVKVTVSNPIVNR